MYGSRNTAGGGGGGSSGFSSNPGGGGGGGGMVPASSSSALAVGSQGQNNSGGGGNYSNRDGAGIRTGANQPGYPAYNNLTQQQQLNAQNQPNSGYNTRGQSPARTSRHAEMYGRLAAASGAGGGSGGSGSRGRNATSTPASVRNTGDAAATRRSRSGTNSPLMYRNQNEHLESYPSSTARFAAMDGGPGGYNHEMKSATRGSSPQRHQRQPGAASRARSLTRDESFDRDRDPFMGHHGRGGGGGGLGNGQARSALRDMSLDRQYFANNNGGYATYDPRRSARMRLDQDMAAAMRGQMDGGYNIGGGGHYDGMDGGMDPYGMAGGGVGGGMSPYHHNSLSHNALAYANSVQVSWKFFSVILYRGSFCFLDFFSVWLQQLFL